MDFKNSILWGMIEQIAVDCFIGFVCGFIGGWISGFMAGSWKGKCSKVNGAKG